MINTIYQELGGWVDKVDINYYIEKSELPITKEFIELIIENYKTTQNIQLATNLAANIIKQNQFEENFYLDQAISIASPYFLQNEIEKAYNEYIDEGFSDKDAAKMALYDWDL